MNIQLPKSYELLSGQSLFVSDVNKYATDKYYNITKDPNQYNEFLDDLFQLAKPPQRKFLEVIRTFIVNYTYCVYVPLDSPYWNYTRNRIIINLNDNKLEQISRILATPFFYVTVTKPYSFRIRYVAVIAKILTFLLTKVSSRPIDYKEVSPRVLQYIIGWFLRKYNQLNASNLSKYSLKADRAFVTSQELKDVLETIKELRDVNDFFDLIGDQINHSTLKQAFISRYGIDIALTFDDFAHLIVDTSSAVYVGFPSILSQYFKASPVKDDADKVARSISIMLRSLPK